MPDPDQTAMLERDEEVAARTQRGFESGDSLSPEKPRYEMHGQYAVLFAIPSHFRERIHKATSRPITAAHDGSEYGIWLRSTKKSVFNDTDPLVRALGGFAVPLGSLPFVGQSFGSNLEWFVDDVSVSQKDADRIPCSFRRRFTRGLLDRSANVNLAALVADAISIGALNKRVAAMKRTVVIAESKQQAKKTAGRLRKWNLNVRLAPRADGDQAENAKIWGQMVRRSTASTAWTNVDVVPQNEEPDVLLGTWRDFAHFDLGDPDLDLDCVVILDAESAVSPRQDVESVLEDIPCGTRVYGCTTNFVSQSDSAQQALTAFYGPHRCLVLKRGRQATPIEVRFLGADTSRRIQTPSKRSKRRDARRSNQRHGKATAVVRLAKRHQRNSYVARTYRKLMSSPDHPLPKQSSVAAMGDSRTCLVAFDGLHVAELLLRSPSHVIGFCEDPAAVIASNARRYHCLQGRLKPIDPGRRGDANVPPSKREIKTAQHVIVSITHVAKVGHRDVYLRADAGTDVLPLTPTQRTVGYGKPAVIIYDIIDAADPAFTARTTRRVNAYRHGNFSCENVDVCDRPRVVRRMRYVTNLPYSTPRKLVLPPKFLSKDEVAVRRARIRLRRELRGAKGCINAMIATPEIVVGALEELSDDQLHGQAPGLEGVSAATLSREEKRMLVHAVACRLAAGAWTPGPERKVEIPKTRGGTRTLMLPNLADRLVGKVLANALTEMGVGQKGIGMAVKGRGLNQMLAEIYAYAQVHGLRRIMTFDIANAFPSVPVDGIITAAKDLAYLRKPDPEYYSFCETYLEPPAEAQYELFEKQFERALRGNDKSTRGISQGSPISPIAIEMFAERFIDPVFGAMNRDSRFGDTSMTTSSSP